MKAANLLFEMQRFSLYLVDHHHQEIWVTVEEEVSERSEAKRASFDEDENYRDEVREMATDII